MRCEVTRPRSGGTPPPRRAVAGHGDLSCRRCERTRRVGHHPRRPTFHPHRRELGTRRHTASETLGLSPVYRCPQRIMPSCAVAEKRGASARWPSVPTLVHGYPPLATPRRAILNNFGTACEHPLIPDFPTTTTITSLRRFLFHDIWLEHKSRAVRHLRSRSHDDGKTPARVLRRHAAASAATTAAFGQGVMCDHRLLQGYGHAEEGAAGEHANRSLQ
jgi:hypothetical protein